jgi:flavorubredoxin
VLDPGKLAYVILLHWEGDENGGMEQFMKEAPKSELIGSLLSIQLKAIGFGLADRACGFRDGETLDLGTHKLVFLETPHVHHWDSMMVLEETSRSLFPSDLFIQPADQPPVVTENLSMQMLNLYRAAGIFAHELPIRQVVDRVEKMESPVGSPDARRIIRANRLFEGRPDVTVTAEKQLLFRGPQARAPCV